jgi:integrase
MTFLCRKKSGIWYYRKTFLLPSGKRKEIRQSLRTSDFKQAQFLALQRYFNTDSDQEVGYSHTFVTWFSKARTKASQLGKSLPELYGARHTAATEMKNAGIPNQFASAVLGHSNNSITYDRYGKGVDVHHLRRAVEAIGQTGRDGQ